MKDRMTLYQIVYATQCVLYKIYPLSNIIMILIQLNQNCFSIAWVIQCYGMVWCGVVWCGVMLCGVVWCGVVWHGMARYGMVKNILCVHN